MIDIVGVAPVATATQRRGWNTDSVTKEQRTDREKARSVRARQRAIGRELRRLYDNVAKEPVPDDFLDLLRKIDETDETRAET
jgi:Anti-sigma factor NepR